MASQIPFEFTPTDYPPYFTASQWVNGEQVLAPTDDWKAVPPGPQTYYFARWMEFEGGIYTIKAQADDNSVWRVGPSLGGQSVFFNVGYSAGAVTSQVWIPRGVMRIDVEVTQLSSNVSPCYFIFSLFKDGQPIYRSQAEGWLFDTTPIPDSGLTPHPDYRLSLPVWSIFPNWREGVSERLSWLTDLLESEDGAEQRRAIRMYPRRTLEMSFMRKWENRTRIDNFALAVGKYQFNMPLFHEQVKMTEGILAGASGVSFTTNGTAVREFREGDIVMVSAGDPNDYELLTVGTVEPMRFDWVDAPKRNWPPGTRIFPCRLAQLVDSPQITGRTDRVSQARIRFELVDPDVRAGEWVEMLDGLPWFPYIPNRAEPVSTDYGRNTFTLDNSSSVVNITDTSQRSKNGLRIAMKVWGREAATAFRNKLARARGRQMTFYCPTFMHDIEPLGDITADDPFIDLRPMGFSQYQLVPQPTRNKFMIQLADGSRVFRNIVDIFEVRNNITQVIEYERFYVDEPMPAILREQIKRISFVSETRLDQDTIEIFHPTAGSKELQISLIMRQVANNRQE